MSNERMIGVLHAYVLLKPILSQAFQTSAKVDNSTSFLHSNGFKTHDSFQKKSKLHIIPSESLPVITRDDACKILEMDVRAANIEYSLTEIWNKLKESIQRVGLEGEF